MALRGLALAVGFGLARIGLAALGPGSCAFLSINGQGPDSFQLVLLEPMSAGETIKVTFPNFRHGVGASGTDLEYTASSCQLPGVTLEGVQNQVSGYDFAWPSGGVQIYNSGDTLIAVSADNTPLCAASTEADTWGFGGRQTALPAGLTANSSDAITKGSVVSMCYQGVTSGTVADVKTAIADLGNWVVNYVGNWVSCTSPATTLTMSDAATQCPTTTTQTTAVTTTASSMTQTGTVTSTIQVVWPIILCATLAMLCMVLGFGLFRRFKRGRPNKMGAGKADRTKDLQDIAVSEATQDADPAVPGGHGDDDQQRYPSQHRDAEPGVAKTKQTEEVAEAEKKLQDAITSGNLANLKAALAAAKEVGVSRELRERALEVQAELLAAKADSPKADSPTRSIPSPSHGSLIDMSRPTPIGVQVCQACEKIYDLLQEPERSNGDDELEDLCRTARLETAPPDLKSSIFGLMRPEDIKSFLQAPDHQFWQQIKQNTEEFIKLLNDPGAVLPYSVDEMTPEANNPKVRSIRPVVMDQSVREPATNTPFGHTGYQKFLTLQIVKCMGFKDIAISGQYYGASYTPETQVLEWMKVKGVPMDGMIVMFAPGKGDREAGIKAIKDFGIPNAFLDLTMKASVRFKQSDFVSSVLETVEILDEIFTGMGFAPNPWRSEEKVNCDPGEGEISVNLVDLMEFLDLKPDGTMDDKKKTEAEDAFRTWKKSDAFRRRVVGILTEEGRGVANYKDYGALSRWLRLHFPRDEEYRILVHAHGGDGNTQDAASVEAALEGANGVWAALIPQAAQSGHNSSMVFLDNMLQMGNGHVLEDFWLHQGAQCARHIYYLNFNSYALPDDCPIWGARVDQLLHTAFSTVSGEEWRRRRGKYYDIWGDDERAQIGRMTRASDLQHKVAMCRSLYRGGNYRISPLVSDIETWRKRIVELGAAVVGPRGRAGDHVREVRDLGFALMNAGIRANMNEQATLKQLWDIATRNKTEKIRCDQIAAYLKAQQHQGEKE